MKFSLILAALLFSASAVSSESVRYVEGKIVNIDKEAKTISIKEVKSRDLLTYRYSNDVEESENTTESQNINTFRKGERVELMLTVR